MLFRGAAGVRMVMKDSIVRKSVPCRGLTLPNNPGSNQEPRREEVGRGRVRSQRKSAPWEGAKIKAEGTDKQVVCQTVIGNEDPGS